MPQAPHRGTGEGVVVGHRALGVDAQDLAGQGLRVLCQIGLRRIARRDVEHAVGSEGNAPAIVDPVLGNAGEDGLGAGGGIIDRYPDDAVVRCGGDVGVEPGAGGVDRNPEQATLAVRCRLVDPRDLRGGPVG